MQQTVVRFAYEISNIDEKIICVNEWRYIYVEFVDGILYLNFIYLLF